MTKIAIHKIASTVLLASMLAVIVGTVTFQGNFAFATKGGGPNTNGNDDDTINGNKADPPGSDAACTGNPHDFSQPTGNPHDPDKLKGNPHECFEFAIPESPIGTAALIMSSLGALGGFVYFGSRKQGTLGPFAHP